MITLSTDKELGYFYPVKIPCNENVDDLLMICKLKEFHSVIIDGKKRFDVINRKIEKWRKR